MMRILMLTPALPYPTHQGGALRNDGLLRGLATAGYRLTLVSFHDDVLNPQTTPLRDLCEMIITLPSPARPLGQRLQDLMFTPNADLAQRLESASMRERLQVLFSEHCFDLVFFEGLEMAIYLPMIRQMQPNARLFYDAHNAEYALQRTIAQIERSPKRLHAALYSREQAKRIRNFESIICQAADCILAVSTEDAEALRALDTKTPVHVIPNGIFTDSYARVNQGSRLDLGEQVLVFTGKMDYRPNIDAMVWFCGTILPKLVDIFPRLKLVIVGQKPHPGIKALASKTVEITGWVPEVQPFLHAAQLYVAPLRMGSGTRLKILEAMASACAVVATPIAASGLVAPVQDAILLAADENAFIAAVVGLMQDTPARTALREAAQHAVRQYYDWSSIIPCLIEIIEELPRG